MTEDEARAVAQRMMTVATSRRARYGGPMSIPAVRAMVQEYARQFVDEADIPNMSFFGRQMIALLELDCSLETLTRAMRTAVQDERVRRGMRLPKDFDIEERE